MTRFNKWLTVAALLLVCLFLVLGMTKVIDNVGSYLEIIGVIWLGLFTNSVIAESGIVNENSRVLREIGIKEVSTIGLLSDMDMDALFPKCKTIKICVISGIGFLEMHKDALKDALIRQGADIRILMARAGSEFLNDLTAQLRAVAHKKGNGDYDVTQAEEIARAKKLVEEWRDEFKLNDPVQNPKNGKIEIRHYNSEYRTKFILGFVQESEDEKGKIYGYYNFGLPVRAPKEYPLFTGKMNIVDREKYVEWIKKEERTGSAERNNGNLHVIVDLDLHFNYLWDKYAPEKNNLTA